MPLYTQTIGASMSHGFAGSYARQPDMIVNTSPAGGYLPFGTPLVRGDGGEVVAMGAGASGNEFIGVAGREIKTATEYNSQSVGTYSPGEAVSVFQRGCINVKCQRGAPAVDAPVYVRVVASGNYVVGGYEAQEDGTNSVAIPNAMWAGAADANGIAEMRIVYVGPTKDGGAGEPGPAGGYYTPSVSAEGELTWTASQENMPDVASANIRGPAGAAGADGAPGAQGPAGAAAGFGIPTATVDNATGTPSVTVSASGPDTAKVFAFEFHNLKGEQGPAGADGAPGATGPQGPAGPSYTLPDATTSTRGGVLQMAAIADLTAAPTMEDFNNLLAALRTAGLLATS